MPSFARLAAVCRRIRSDASAEPSFERIANEHATYVAALRDAGLTVDVLPPLERYPDSMFVEDPAFVLRKGRSSCVPAQTQGEGRAKKSPERYDRHFDKVLH